MKRKLLLLLSILIISGCTNINNLSYSELIDQSLDSDLVLLNEVSTGYKYYLPRGVTLKEDNDFNQKLAFMDTYLYMYVDIISYYYKNELNYRETEDFSYFYQNIEKDGKTGYVGIRQEGDQYFVKIVYNYAKIEAYVSENQISSTISYAMILLNSIRYNDTLIDRIVNDTSVNSSEITYEIDKPSGSESKFSQYLSEYVQEEDNDNDVVLPDEYENE